METAADLIHANSTGGVASRVLAVLNRERGEFRTVRSLARDAQAPESSVLLAVNELVRLGQILKGNVGGADVVWVPLPD